MLKLTNAIADVLEIIQPLANQIEYDILKIKETKHGDKYIIDIRRLNHIVTEIVNNSGYKNYHHRERLIDEVKNNLASYFELRLRDRNPSYPVRVRVGDKKKSDELIKNYYQELISAGITENGIDEKAHEKEVELISNIIRIQKNKLQPIPFTRYRDFTIIEQGMDGETPKKIALLNVFTSKSSKEYFEKHNISKKKYSGIDISDGEDTTTSSTTKLPCILEWSLYHQLNYFNIGTPKTAKLTYDNDKNEFYLHVTFQFLPHVDEYGKLHYLKTAFDKRKTEILEANIDEGKKLKAYSCYDALTGEAINISSTNKTTQNAARETITFLGVDMGRVMLAAFAVVKDGKVLYKDYAETSSLSKTLYKIYENITELQKAGKENKKVLVLLRKKIAQITRYGVHKTANRIVWARDYYNSQLILENLTGLRSLPKKKVQQYNKLSDILTYKSQLKGFKLNTFNPPKAYYEINPSQTSKMCSKCGYTHEDNRRIEISQKDFKCVHCGYEANSDINAAINIARFGEFYFKYKDSYKDFDEYLVNLAGCTNANFTNYREERKRRRMVLDISKLLEKQIKSAKHKHNESLAVL